MLSKFGACLSVDFDLLKKEYSSSEPYFFNMTLYVFINRFNLTLFDLPVGLIIVLPTKLPFYDIFM